MSEGAFEVDLLLQDSLAWDLYFEFKTALTGVSGTIFHAFSSVDSLLISIQNGSSIKAVLNDFEIKASLPQNLDNNQWHSLSFEFNTKEMTLFLDKNSTKANKTVDFHRPLMLKKAFVGATNDFTEGYIGCLRNLWINGDSIKLAEIGKNHPKGLHGVIFGGCNGACDVLPCKNEGMCQEYYQRFACDCHLTAFKGQTCQEEVSVIFNGTSIEA